MRFLVGTEAHDDILAVGRLHLCSPCKPARGIARRDTARCLSSPNFDIPDVEGRGAGLGPWAVEPNSAAAAIQVAVNQLAAVFVSDPIAVALVKAALCAEAPNGVLHKPR